MQKNNSIWKRMATKSVLQAEVHGKLKCMASRSMFQAKHHCKKKKKKQILIKDLSI
jgi:hypothetical protein